MDTNQTLQKALIRENTSRIIAKTLMIVAVLRIDSAFRPAGSISARIRGALRKLERPRSRNDVAQSGIPAMISIFRNIAMTPRRQKTTPQKKYPPPFTVG